MSARLGVVRSLSALAFALLPLVAVAAPSSTDTRLDFTVLRDGRTIGHHQIGLSREGDSEAVSIRTDILVRVASVPVYRFEQSGSEFWRNGHLVSLNSQTNDNGDRHTLAVTAEADRVEVIKDGSHSQVRKGIMPASLWNSDLVNQVVLLNPQNGQPVSVSVAYLGEDTIRSRGADTRVRHYRVTGELQRELWYDPLGTLVQVEFKAIDNSSILFVLE